MFIMQYCMTCNNNWSCEHDRVNKFSRGIFYKFTVNSSITRTITKLNDL